MDSDLRDQLINYFEEYVSEHKQELIAEVLEQRTRRITVVLEDIFKSHNASAVLRTCECFGIQDLHIIQKDHEYVPNPYVTRGATKWLTLHHYEKTVESIDFLKSEGYRIVVTVPDQKAVSHKEFPVRDKLALVFGTEFTGVSEEVMKAADDFIYIPMVGFTESLNISVSAAVIINEMTSRLKSSHPDWKLSDEEKRDIRLDWYRNIVKRSALLEEKFVKENT